MSDEDYQEYLEDKKKQLAADMRAAEAFLESLRNGTA